MRNDLKLTFGDIFDHDFEAFRNQLLEIQTFRKGREESERWVQVLRFLNVSGVPRLERIGEERPTRLRRLAAGRTTSATDASTLSVPIVEEELGEASYIAVSWRWISGTNQGDGTAETSFDYWIQRRDENSHKSQFPDHYLERVIRFAQEVDIDNIWIDKESIFQREGDDAFHPKDQDLGVQIMDVVYDFSHYSLGLMTVVLEHQHEIDMLHGLISLSIFVDPKDTKHPTFKNVGNQPEAQILILKVLSDPRWSRGWIFQEDHLASDRMVLLIPHSKYLKKHRDFGSIPGELQVNCADLRKAVTMFCMASGETDRWPASEILGKAKQYNIWNKIQYDTALGSSLSESSVMTGDSISTQSQQPFGLKRKDTLVSLYPSTTLSVLDDICNRDLFIEGDRVAIMANASRFSVRLNIAKTSLLMTSDRYSLSTALLALVLLNGEILADNLDMSQSDLLGHSLRSYLEACQYKFNAPSLRYEQSFIDHCRYRSPTITKQGMRVKGFLFKLLPRDSFRVNPLELSEQDKEYLYLLQQSPRATRVWKWRKLSKLADEIIQRLINNLRHFYEGDCYLVDFLRRHLELDRHPPPAAETKPSTSYIIRMLSALAEAIFEERDVRLAIFHNENEATVPSAIFIPPVQQGGWANDETAWVFTSWDNGWRGGGMERLASLEVSVPEGLNQKIPVEDPSSQDFEASTVLKSHGWVNGISNTVGRTMRSYAFSLPGISDRGPG
jgi:hypothetical protein